MKKIKSINVMSVFKMSAALGAVAGVLVGVVLFVINLTEQRFVEGIATLLLAPLLYGFVGALVNAFMAWSYNKAAEYLGGLEIQLEDPQ